MNWLEYFETQYVYMFDSIELCSRNHVYSISINGDLVIMALFLGLPHNNMRFFMIMSRVCVVKHKSIKDFPFLYKCTMNNCSIQTTRSVRAVNRWTIVLTAAVATVVTTSCPLIKHGSSEILHQQMTKMRPFIRLPFECTTSIVCIDHYISK